MSDITATNCGGSCSNGFFGGCGNNSCIWIIILLFCCGCGNSGFCGGGCDDGCGMGRGCDNNSCIWIILILLLCGNC